MIFLPMKPDPPVIRAFICQVKVTKAIILTVGKIFITKNITFELPVEVEERNYKESTHFPETNTNHKYSSSLVIPAYNEERRIRPFLNSLLSVLPDSTEIIVVFDGDDGTPEVVRSFGERVQLLQFPHRIGKGGAIIEGFKKSSGSVVGFVDADGAISATEILKLESMVSAECPCVVGSRWVKSSVVETPEPVLNVFAGRVFHYLVYLILGVKTKDTQCGVKFFHRTLLDSVINQVTVKNRMIDVALLYHTKLLNCKITEVGITWRHVEGTKLPILKVIPLMFATILGLRVIHSRRFRDTFMPLSQVYSDWERN